MAHVLHGQIELRSPLAHDGRLLRRVDGDVQFSEGRRMRGASVGDESVHGGRRRRHVQRAEGEEVAKGARPAIDL